MKITKRNLFIFSVLITFFCVRKGYAQENAINTGTMYISSGTIVADESSFTTSGTGSTENNGDFYLKGSWVNDGAYVTGTGKVTFWGSSAQDISGSSGTIFYNATVNKPANGVTVNTDADVFNVLTLTSGPVNLNSHKITIRNAAVGGIAYTNGYLISEQADNSGILQWNMGSTTGAHIIPFGKASGAVIPLTLDLTSGAPGNVTTSTYSTAANNTPYPVTPYAVTNMNDGWGNDNTANVVDRFWEIDEDDGANGTITITFTYAAGEEPANGEAGLVSQRFYSTYWEAPAPFQSANAGLNTVTTPTVTSFGPFTLSQSAHPLPVNLLSFKATLNSQRIVDINWVTASETNSDYFTVERSKDLNTVESIDKITGAASSALVNKYNTVDKNPYSGVSFYRIKQTDFDGKFSYSEWNTINNNKNGSFYITHAHISSYANEFKVSFTVPENGDVTLNLFNAIGEVVYSKIISADKGSNTFTLPITHYLVYGVYNLNVMYSNEVKSVKLMRNL